MADRAREVAFTRAFFRNLERIEESIGRRSAMRHMIERYDNNVAEAWRHLKPGEPTYGFIQLAENRLLYLSIEALMLEAEWHDIFTRENRAEAVRALSEFEPEWASRVDGDYVLKK